MPIQTPDKTFETYMMESMIETFENANVADFNTEDYRIMAVTQAPELARYTRKMFNALMVLTRDSKIRAFLEQNDPKALNQALEATGDIRK
jgi:hypothetical protein